MALISVERLLINQGEKKCAIHYVNYSKASNVYFRPLCFSVCRQVMCQHFRNFPSHCSDLRSCSLRNFFRGIAILLCIHEMLEQLM